MTQAIKLKSPRLSRAEIDRRVLQYLTQIQQSLMPAHASEYVAINLETGDYTLGHTPHEAVVAYRSRWRGQLLHLCRVDGGPAFKFHGK